MRTIFQLWQWSSNPIPPAPALGYYGEDGWAEANTSCGRGGIERNELCSEADHGPKKTHPTRREGRPQADSGRAKLLLDEIFPLPKEDERAVRDTPPSEPVMLSLDDPDDLAGHVAAQANHAGDKKLQTRLDRVYRKIACVLDTHTDEAEPSVEGTISFVESLAELLAGEGPSIPPMPEKSKKGEDQYPIRLTEKQREALLATRLRRGLKTKIEQVPSGVQTLGFTIKEMEDLAEEVDTALASPPARTRSRCKPSSTSGRPCSTASETGRSGA